MHPNPERSVEGTEGGSVWHLLRLHFQKFHTVNVRGLTLLVSEEPIISTQSNRQK